MWHRPKNELHHWWPRGLSQFWADETGHTHCITSDGELRRSLPKSFGAIRNDNNIAFKSEPSPWDESFEHVFAKADDAFPDLIAWLQGVTSPIAARQAPFVERFTPMKAETNQLEALGECLASLIARSPSFRHRISITAEYYRTQFGFPDPKPDKTLIRAGARGAQKELSAALRSGGKVVVLRSGEQEFIFGDGFLHNFSSADRPHAPRCLIPLTPDIAIFYTRPMSYRAYPKLLALNLTADEVTFVNRTVQVYAERFLFFRSIHPVIEEPFTQGQHLEFEYHKHQWIENLQDAAAQTFFGADNDFSPAAKGVKTS